MASKDSKVAELDHRLTDEILELWKSQGKQSVLKTTGFSMLPTLEPGDEIVVRHIDVGEIKRGDLVTFKVGPEVVTHRVLKRIETDGDFSFLQKGDKGPRCFPLPACTVVGRVVEIRLKSGKHVISLTSWFARSAGCLVALLEVLFAGPIQYFSRQLRDKNGPRKQRTLFFYRVLLRLRDKTIQVILKTVRVLCRSRIKTRE